jgi:hypothetical protein
MIKILKYIEDASILLHHVVVVVGVDGLMGCPAVCCIDV